MKSSKLFLKSSLVILGLTLSACGSSSSSSPAASSAAIGGLANGPVLSSISGVNVMALTVNGSNCSGNPSEDYPNKPCVQLTLCAPSGGNCQVISDVLLDTGSYGLRVFKSALTTGLANALTPVTNGSQTIAECAQFGDGSSDWGPVKMAMVGLGNEPLVQVPIQIIDSTFTGASANCSGADTTPVEAGFSAILGVGLFAQDCGAGCAGDTGNGMYFSCTSSSCSGFGPQLSQQVTNPVAKLPSDNNGVVVELPSLPLGGSSNASGYLVLGIGTQSNNVPSGVSAFPADPNYGEFSTSFNGQTYAQSFIDSGSNGLFFDPLSLSGELSDCGSNLSGWICASGTLGFSATNSGYSGNPSIPLNFNIGNAQTLVDSSNAVFSELAGDTSDGGLSFDWGLPFYFGRNVYVGLENTSSAALGVTGPYWAY